jgi:25S rRNA (uracil2843-N3)-methyltransferase
MARGKIAQLIRDPLPPKQKTSAKDKDTKGKPTKSKQAKQSTRLVNVPSEGKVRTAIRTKLQQQVLDVFKDSFSDCLSGPDLQSVIQQVKQNLFDRNFADAFGKPEFLEAYTVRWSPSRALGYLDLFEHLFGEEGQAELENLGSPSVKVDQDGTGNVAWSKITCLGAGGGAELVAFAGFLSHHREKVTEDNAQSTEAGSQPISTQGKTSVTDVALVDISDWGTVIDALNESFVKIPQSSKYSVVKQDPLLGRNELGVSFKQGDLLELSIESLGEKLKGAKLVTLMFTLNELYSTSMSKTTNFLLSLTFLLEPGALLLVVDSPGSYSTVKLGNEKEGDLEKKYPMQWLLEHTLLNSSTVGSSKNTSKEKQWEKVYSEESRWFRLGKDLVYPLALEDMRYQVHLYRRI